MVKKIADLEEFEAQKAEAANSGKLLVVDYFATWCPPCQMVCQPRSLNIHISTLCHARRRVCDSQLPCFLVPQIGPKFVEMAAEFPDAILVKVLSQNAPLGHVKN